MLNVMIIDDEPMIIQSIKSGIDWEKLNLNVVYTATDSRSALSYAKENSVDIVISDISMPPFNGLTLCNEILKINNKIQLIIISGYADFSYAQKAIQIGVVGYCLKPINYNELTAILKTAISRISPSKNFADYDFIEYVYENNINEIKSYLNENNIREKFYLAISIGKKNLSSYIKSHHLVFNLGINKFLYILNDNTRYLINSRLVNEDTLIEGIGLANDKVSYGDMLTEIDEIRVKSYNFFFNNENKIFDDSYNVTDEYYLDICNNIDNLHELKKKLKSLSCDSIKKINIKQAMKIHNMILNKYKKYDNEEDLNIYSFDELIRNYDSFEKMTESLLNTLEDNSQNNNLVYESNNKNFLKIIKYINANFTNNISIKDMADELFLNANYISQLFKKETGTTYVKYLTKLRVDKAKNLLKETDMSINDVCINSGFNDYFYFMKIFKKQTTMAPSYYRKKCVN